MTQTAAMRHLPNALTIGRILITPVVLVLLLTPTLAAQAGAFALFILASVSDWLDGRLARQMGAHSRLGTFLDPLADKILVLGTFIIIAVKHPHLAPWWAVFLIAARDAGVTGLRVWAESRGATLETLAAAKAKTLSQLIYLLAMLLLFTLAQMPGDVGAMVSAFLADSLVPLLALYIVVILTVGTGLLYAYRYYYSSNYSRTPTS